MHEDGIWEIDELAVGAFADIADARLVVLKNLEGYGFRWVVMPKRDGRLVFGGSRMSGEVNSEAEPYPTMKAAMDACERFYSWEWHGVR